MAAAIDLRSDFDGDALRRFARASKDGRQVRRLLALAAIYDGDSRSEAARNRHNYIDSGVIAHYNDPRLRTPAVCIFGGQNRLARFVVTSPLEYRIKRHHDGFCPTWSPRLVAPCSSTTASHWQNSDTL